MGIYEYRVPRDHVGAFRDRWGDLRVQVYKDYIEITQTCCS